MPQRRANDAQVERLLRAMQSLEYRQALARQVAGISAGAKLPEQGTDKRRAYKSAMRRFERYVTDATQKRDFAAAPASARQTVVVAARRVPLPQDYESLPPARSHYLAPGFERDVTDWTEEEEDESEDEFEDEGEPAGRPEFFAEVPPSDLESSYQPPEYWETDLYDLRALLAYYDSDSKEAAEQLAGTGSYTPAQEDRWSNMLDLAASGVDVLGMRGAGTLSDAYRDLVDSFLEQDREDLEDFNALLHDLPDWQIEMILADMAEGKTTFADWIDAWHDSDMDFDVDENEYWALWREAYSRAKK